MEKPFNLLRVLFFALLVVAAIPCLGQKKYSRQIYRAYIKGDMGQWSGVISSLEHTGTPTMDDKLELLEYYYGHVGYLIGNGQRMNAKDYIEKADRLAESILRVNPHNSTALAIKGAFMGYKMELNKTKAPVLGPRCIATISKAHRMNPANVQALCDMGHMLYHTPGIFGGDKVLGMTYLRRAISAIEQNGDTSENWFYLNLMVILAQYETESGSLQAAKALYEKILAMEPGFAWVRDELYPALPAS